PRPSRRWMPRDSAGRRRASTNLEGREAHASSRVMVRTVEQRPVLFAFVRELLEHEKLQEFADSLPTRARVSEPALPLVVSALHLLEQGAFVVVSAAAASEGLPPERARPEPLRIAPGDERGIEALTEALALAGYERVERAEERGQFAVRGGLVDVFPTTGREPLRVEFWGDEIEQIRAFSPFTQRALHEVEAAVVYPAAERRLDLVEPNLADDGAATP